MPAFVYRFRRVEALLGPFQELDRQEIYFAPPAELNDPYDGAVEVQWSGDLILWTNFLNHYLLCLTQALIRASIEPDDPDLLNQCIILGSDAALPTDQMKVFYQLTKTRFFADTDAARIPGLLAASPRAIGRNELCMYLRVLHVHTVNLVLEVMRELDLIGSSNAGSNKPFPFGDAAGRCCQMLEVINSEENVKPERGDVGGFFGELSESVSYQQSLLFLLDGGATFAGKRGLLAVVADFPAHYLTGLESLLYSDWFTACFVEEATNAAMWGVYGDSHKGVALKFRTVEANGQPALVLNRVTGVSGRKGSASVTGRSDVPHLLEPVRYPAQFAKIDFFQNMGRITGEEARFWHFDAAGNRSPQIVAAGYDTNEWRNKYWQTLTTALATKHEDWKHERERRIILRSDLVDLRASKDDRKLKYRFEDLEGIVFGAMMPAESVMEIVRAVRKKCRQAGRTKFEFFRAEYSPQKGKMSLVPLSLIKVD